ncbi:MAG: fibronectin type III domain-containing protein [Acutalibacteraceae bacterium]
MKKFLKPTLALLFCIITIMATMTMTFAISAPTAKIKSVTVSSVTVYWTKVSGADGYQIQATTDGKNWTATATLNSKTTEYTYKNLTAGKSYGFRVRAYDKNILGKYVYSSWTKMITAKPLPSKVTGFKVKAANHEAVQLVWNKVSGVSGYTVQFYSGGKWKTYKSLSANSIIISGLKPGKTYNFRVAAVKVVNNKWIYGPVSDTVKGGAVLKTPSLFVLTGVNSSGLKIEWSKVSGAQGYEIFDYAKNQWIDTKTTAGIKVLGLKPATKYSFKMRAYYGSYKGPETAVKTFTTAPTNPTGITLKETTSTSATISWDAVDGAEGYQAAYFNPDINDWVIFAATQAKQTTITGISNTKTYTFRVRAYTTNKDVYKISAYACSPWTADASKDLKFSAGLPASKNFKTQGISETQIKLTWDRVTNAKGYTVEKYDLNSTDWAVFDFTNNKWIKYSAANNIDDIITTENTFTDSFPVSNHTTTSISRARGELFRIRAVSDKNIIGEATAPVGGNTTDITIDTNPLEQTITFPAIEGATSYYVTSANTGAYTHQIGSFTSEQLNVKDGVCTLKLYLAPDTIHSVTVTAKDNNNASKGFALNKTTFKTGALTIITDKNNANYNKSVHSQLLYAAQAINNTKQYSDDIRVDSTTEVSYAMNTLSVKMAGIPFINAKTTKEVEEAMNSLNEEGDEAFTASSVEKTSESYIFSSGRAKLEDGKTLLLPYYLEPTTSTKTAHLPKDQDPNDWVNGFSSVATTKAADGSVTMTINFKQEKNKTTYHDGFMSTFNSAMFDAIEGFNIESSTVGASKLVLKISPDGIVQSFVADSPFSAAFSANFNADDAGVIKLVEMSMSLSGKTTFNYKITELK